MSSPVISSDVPTLEFAQFAVQIAPVANGKGLQADLDRIRAEARATGFREGYDAGHGAGHADGFAEGYHEGVELAAREAASRATEESLALAAELAALRTRMQLGWDAFIAAAHDAMAERAMLAVRELLAHELTLSREGAVAIVQRCLAEVSHAGELRVRVAAADLPLLESRRAEIEAALDGRGVTFAPDPEIAAGCIVESTGGRVDGTIPTALDLMEEAARQVA